MLEIKIRFKSMSVEGYSPKDGARVRIVFNDGLKDRVFLKMFAGGKIAEISDSIFKDIRDFEKEQNPADSYDPFSVVNVKIEDEDNTAGKINNFFEKIASEIKYINGYTQGHSYLGVVNRLKNMRSGF